MMEGLAGILEQDCRFTVITGAGVSTASGIPDYRDAQGNWKRRPPVQFHEFTGSVHTRRRYWARSLIGWPRFAAAAPNAAHHALAELDRLGRVRGLVTQNVDGLHQRAGSRAVLDLHGRLDRVVCLGCGAGQSRGGFQRRLMRLNPGFVTFSARLAPDGDADLEGVDFAGFRVPECAQCGGMLKPDVVFYGEGIPRERTQRALDMIEAAEALLVVGTSLMVWSAYRLVRRAAERGIPVHAINLGRTRADALLRGRVAVDCHEALQVLLAQAAAAQAAARRPAG